MTPTAPIEPSGSWDSIHVFETAERGRQAHYKLTSTVMLQLVTRRGGEGEAEGAGAGEGRHEAGERKGGIEGWKREGEVSLSGSMTRQVRFWLVLWSSGIIRASFVLSYPYLFDKNRVAIEWLIS